jgi:hypothetical protein
MSANRIQTNGHMLIDLCNFSGTTMAAINNLPVVFGSIG